MEQPQPIFRPGTKVFDRGNPGIVGTVSKRDPKPTAAGWKYRIDLPDGAYENKLESTLEEYFEGVSNDPEELLKSGFFGRPADLRRNLTYRILNGHLANIVYSLGVTNTEFYPHQFKPLLTLLESPATGLLIADEVGLGKTIEAGLIWTELRAREDLNNLLIVCPAALKDKWQTEMSLKFGIDSEQVNTQGLISAIKSPKFKAHSQYALIASYDAISQPSKSIKKNKQETLRMLSDILQAEDEGQLFDCVIFDEAHEMRNRSSARWKGGAALTNASAYQIMLSATPINLKNDDLFNLLHLLDPDSFAYPVDFEQSLNDNAVITRARDLVLDTRTSISDISNKLNSALNTERFSKSNRLLNIVAKLEKRTGELNKKERVEFASAIEKVSLLSHVVTRTRKRDVIKNKVTRKVKKIPVKMSDFERNLYELVTTAVLEYGLSKSTSHGFLVTQPQRMVTSCPSIFGPYLDSDSDLELEESKPVKTFVANRLKGAFSSDLLRDNDSKFQQLKNIILELDADDPKDKIIVFSTFRGTVDYISTRLNEQGVEATSVKGGDPRSKEEIIERFKSSDSCRVLVSTEVLAQGVDLQFCSKLVNYDLPWNPTKIEQRIGRIDRLGQEKEIIHVFNLYYDDTVDSRVLYRLYERIGIFEEALGESETVLGEEISRVEEYFYSKNRTAIEEKEFVERSEMALEQIKLDKERLNDDKEYLITHGQSFHDRIEVSEQLSRAVDEKDLIDYVKSFVASQRGGYTFQHVSGNRYKVKLPPSTTVEFKEFCEYKKISARTKFSLGHSVDCEFNKEVTRQNTGSLEYINQFHPLINFISRQIESQSDNVHPLVAVRLKRSVNLDIPLGHYLFYVESWYLPGVKKEEYFAYRAYQTNSQERLDELQEESLVQLCRTNGEEWLDAKVTVDVALSRDVLEIAEDSLNEEFKARKIYKQNENRDRIQEQRYGYEKFHKRRTTQLEHSIAQQQQRESTKNIAKMNIGKLKKQNDNYELKMAELNRKETAEMKKTVVCVGIVDVYI